jgi:PleD family two-component response regulator
MVLSVTPVTDITQPDCRKVRTAGSRKICHGQRISISLEEKVDYTLVWQILMVSGMVLVVAVVWLRKTQSFNREISNAYDLLEEKNKALEKLSIIDPLTDLYNRHKLDMEFAREMKQANRYHRPVGKGAYNLAEALRQEVQSFDFLPETTITISVGVAEYEPGEDGDQLLKRADDNLYKAKHTTRNTICG